MIIDITYQKLIKIINHVEHEELLHCVRFLNTRKIKAIKVGDANIEWEDETGKVENFFESHNSDIM